MHYVKKQRDLLPRKNDIIQEVLKQNTKLIKSIPSKILNHFPNKPKACLVSNKSKRQDIKAISDKSQSFPKT